MRTRTTVACLCAATLVGITAFAYAEHAFKPPAPQEIKTQPTPPKASPPDAAKPASEGLGMPLDNRCRKVKNACLEQCCSKLPTPDCGFTYFNCVNECMKKHGCLGATNDQKP